MLLGKKKILYYLIRVMFDCFEIIKLLLIQTLLNFELIISKCINVCYNEFGFGCLLYLISSLINSKFVNVY